MRSAALRGSTLKLVMLGLFLFSSSLTFGQELPPRTEIEQLKRDALAVFSMILRDGSDSDRLSAVNSLVRNGDEDVVPLLAEALLNDQAPFVRRTAAEGLSRFRSSRAAPALRHATLFDSIASIRWAAGVSLTAWSLEERAIMGKLLEESPTIAAAAVSLQESSSVPRFPGALWPLAEAALLKSFPNREIYNVVERAAMLKALAQLGSIAAISHMRQTLNLPTEDPFVRGAAAFALGTLGARDAVNDLIAALDTTLDAVQVGAVGALGRFGDVYVIEPLRKMLREARSAEVRSAAATALAALGSASVPALAHALQSDVAPMVRRSAVRSLAHIGGPEATRAVLSLLDSGYLQQCDPSACSELALDTLTALAQLGEVKVALQVTQATLNSLRDLLPFFFVFAEASLVRTLSEVGRAAPELFDLLLNDASPFVQALGLTALANVRESDTRDVLLHYVNAEENTLVRRAALEGLSRWAVPDDITIFASVVTNRDPRTRAAAFSMIARVGDVRVLAPLREALKSESISIQLDSAGASLAFAIRSTRLASTQRNP